MTFNAFLRAACPPLDLNWRKYRRRAARHRVDNRLEQLGLESYAEYLERLRSDPEEAACLADRMCVTVSRFFRERQCWELLAARVVPQLAGEVPHRPLRAWSVGCCGGEEPYTLALLRREQLPALKLEIIATDIDKASLERARQGCYPPSSLQEVPDRVRDRYFRRTNGHWQLEQPVRNEVRLLRHNLLREPPPGEFDLICCRYLAFTYYRGARLLAAARRLQEALRPGGALMLGYQECPGPALDLFRPWPEVPGIYRRRRGALDGRRETGIG